MSSSSDCVGVVVFRNREVAGSWPELVDRLERQGTWVRWAAAEPVLATVGGPAGLAAALAPGAKAATADALLGGLVRLAAVDGGDEQDAVLVVLHALAEGAAALAGRAQRSADSLAVVVGELTCQIRAFPWRRRTRAYAANLLADTRHQLWIGELRPVGWGDHPDQAQLVNPLTWIHHRLDPALLAGGTEDRPMELAGLLSWAAAAGVAPVADLKLLWDRVCEAADHRPPAPGPGVSERTLRRRRRRTVQALRENRSAYLAAVA